MVPTKLPKWYIGSTTIKKYFDGYNGSVSSKKFRKIYEMEQQINKHLFKTRILSFHENRIDAIEEELRLQLKHNVVTNSNYFNESYAKPNGCFGRDVNGELNPNKNNKWSISQKTNYSNKLKGCQYVNDGKNTIRIYKGDKIPNGYVKGVLRKSSQKNKVWVNDGKREFYLFINEMKVGYHIGRLNKSVKDKIIINNGLVNIYIEDENNIPLGFNKGPKKYQCFKCKNYFDAGNLKKHHNNKCVCFQLQKGNITSSKLYSKEEIRNIYHGLLTSSEDNPIGQTKLQITKLSKSNKIEYKDCFIKELK